MLALKAVEPEAAVVLNVKCPVGLSRLLRQREVKLQALVRGVLYVFLVGQLNGCLAIQKDEIKIRAGQIVIPGMDERRIGSRSGTGALLW